MGMLRMFICTFKEPCGAFYFREATPDLKRESHDLSSMFRFLEELMVEVRRRHGLENWCATVSCVDFKNGHLDEEYLLCIYRLRFDKAVVEKERKSLGPIRWTRKRVVKEPVVHLTADEVCRLKELISDIYDGKHECYRGDVMPYPSVNLRLDRLNYEVFIEPFYGRLITKNLEYGLLLEVAKRVYPRIDKELERTKLNLWAIFLNRDVVVRTPEEWEGKERGKIAKKAVDTLTNHNKG